MIRIRLPRKGAFFFSETPAMGLNSAEPWSKTEAQVKGNSNFIGIRFVRMTPELSLDT
jgi:hypothetical protein